MSSNLFCNIFLTSLSRASSETQGLFSPFFTFLRSIYIFPPVYTFPRPLYLPLGLRGCFLTIPDSLRNQKFPLYLESGFKTFWIRMPDSTDTCGRKPYPERKVADSKVPGYVWTRLAEKRLYWAAKTLDYIFLRFLCKLMDYDRVLPS